MSLSTDREPCNCEQALSLARQLADVHTDMRILADAFGREEFIWSSRKKEIEAIVNKYRE